MSIVSPPVISQTTHHRSRWSMRLLQMSAAALLLIAVLPAAISQPVDNSSQQAQQEREQDKIDYLIASVAALKGASFIRNGSAYDASRAASHMRLKLRFAGSRVRTAEDFIRYCGTQSSTSGIRYTIRFADGHTVDSASYFEKKLAQYKPEKAPAANP